MGKNQSTAASWSVDDWAYGTGQNAVSIDEVAHQAGKIPEKYFGGHAIQNDASMHQMQRDLLAFDDTLKNLFQRKKHKRPRNNDRAVDESYYYEEQQQSEVVAQPTNLQQNQTYVSPIDAPRNPGKLIWRCGDCTAENKISESVCRRCGQSETRL